MKRKRKRKRKRERKRKRKRKRARRRERNGNTKRKRKRKRNWKTKRKCKGERKMERNKEREMNRNMKRTCSVSFSAAALAPPSQRAEVPASPRNFPSAKGECRFRAKVVADSDSLGTRMNRLLYVGYAARAPAENEPPNKQITTWQPCHGSRTGKSRLSIMTKISGAGQAYVAGGRLAEPDKEPL